MHACRASDIYPAIGTDFFRVACIQRLPPSTHPGPLPNLLVFTLQGKILFTVLSVLLYCCQQSHSRVTLLQMGLIQSLVFPQPSTHHPKPSALPDQCFSPACWPSIQADAQMLNDKYQSPGKYQNKCDSGTNHPWVLTPDLTRDFSASLNPRQMPQPPPVRVIFLHTLTHRYHHSMARRMTLLGELSSSQPSSQFPCSFPFP